MMSSKMSDADNAFGVKQGLKVKKQKKSQGSSRYRPVGAQELVALPLLKGRNTSFPTVIKHLLLFRLDFLSDAVREGI